MNALGMMLLGSIAHATLFAIAGMGAYLAIRRWGPAAGSVAAASGLVVMAVVSLLALSPWPRWWSWTIGPAAAASPERPVDDESTGRSEGSSAAESGSARRAIGLLLEELGRPLDDKAATVWGWREWLALAFSSSLALGLDRLGLGIRAIAQLRRRGRPVEDPEVEEWLRVLRAELGGMPAIEVREVAELSTAATIGWRRPVLLLPADWRDWDLDERRAVLAHELAHVRRGDFLAGVAAQIALALHFYHPMAHWLAARLRLEQELAADAWGARLSGSRSHYLAALARMALRRNARTVTGAVRAFLISPGTLVRRIEMLKDHRPARQLAMSPAGRVATIAAMAAIGIAVTGVRGALGEPRSMAREQPAKAEPPPSRKASARNLRHIALAFHTYHSDPNHNSFPMDVNRDKGKFPYSWRVAILPYFGQQDLYDQYRFDEPWDGPHNRGLIDKMPAVYSYPGPDGKPTSRSRSAYFVFSGPSTVVGDVRVKWDGVVDGPMNTILVVEARRKIPWTKPEDLPFDPAPPLPEARPAVRPSSLGGFDGDGFNALFVDGSVRFISRSIEPAVLKALITRDGQERIDSDSPHVK